MSDLQILQKMLPNAFFIDPALLQLDKIENKIYIFDNRSKQKIYVDQFILELFQWEITSIPFEIVSYLVNSCTILNDMRTIFIVHNKSFLTLLSDDALLSDYLTPHHHAIIRKHRNFSIRPECIKDSPYHRSIVEEKADWLIKPCLYGKGEGIVFGKDVSQSHWLQIIDNCIATRGFIFQKYLKQERFDLLHQSKDEVEWTIKNNYLVGCILCYNNEFLGEF